ncbi:ABC transporter ATP-binding protein, partial [Candidatus Omnitrophota bacterium]
FYAALPLIGEVVKLRNEILSFFPSYHQLNKLNEQAKKLTHTPGKKVFNNFSKEILFERVNFSYHGQEHALRNISIKIEKGSMIALVGGSGAGKTTLIDLLLRFYDPDNGRILVDGADLKELNILSWRKKIGYVPQEDILFNMSIYENLIWAKNNASDKEIAIACETANVNQFLNGLHRGIHTIIGDRGVRLSGGQRQRISLARAVLRKPELLILDEATSSLDTYSERLIQESIENIAKETTVVVIAHRLSTISNSDYIYALKDGQVVEEGSYTDLMGSKGYFNQMVELQGIGKKTENVI